MKKGFMVTMVVSTCASVLSACNSTDALYAQGPWGPSHVRRSYPEYSAPWGRGQTVPIRTSIVEEPAAAVISPAEIGSRRLSSRADEMSFEPEQPLRPPVARPDYSAAPAPVAPLVPEQPSATAGDLSSGQRPAEAEASPPGVFSPARRPSSYAGSWKAVVGTSSCRVQLSSAPSLDLYKASTQGCASSVLEKVNGWSFRDNQVVLFSRGEVVARLSGPEASLEGTAGTSGTSIRMTR